MPIWPARSQQAEVIVTLDQLYMWHREQQERWGNLAANNKANLPAVYKASLKRTYERKANFHSQAVALLKSLRLETSVTEAAC
jgi:hypothetical protein